MSRADFIVWALAPLAFLAAVIALSGCDDEQHAEAAPKPPSPAKIVVSQVFEIGSSAEARTFELGDGSCWLVIGRPERFVVFERVNGAWVKHDEASAPPAVVPR